MSVQVSQIGVPSEILEEAANVIEGGRAQKVLCNGDKLLECLQAAGVWLDGHVAQINALNVFPVPDGDTGTNMSMTVRAALDEAGSQSYKSVSDLARKVAHGALMGARGNSGVILSQILRGFARALDDKEMMTPADLAQALREGAATAYKGVVKPVEGTILTVAREAAQAAEAAAASGADLEQVIVVAHREATASLARTPKLLPVLAAAGVVDAGGQGYVTLLEGALRHMRGESVEILLEMQSEGLPEHDHTQPPEGDYNYDTQFIIKGTNLPLEEIRAEILEMGDSVLVVGDHETIKVHVHCDAPGRALDYGITQGHVTNVIIENMQLQYEEFKARHAPDAEPQDPGLISSGVRLCATESDLTDIGVIAVVSGDGLQKVFESLGVSAIVSGGQTMNPSTQDLLLAIESLPQSMLILLPNNGNIILTAQQAKELSSKRVVVVPTKTVPQGIAALLAFNYQADLDGNQSLMSEASRQVQTAEVTMAVRSVQVNGLSITEGQIIGLVDGDLVTVGESISDVVNSLLSRLALTNYEIVSVYYGEDVTAEDAAELAKGIEDRYPDLEVEVLNGGQAHYYYVISAE